LKEKGYPSLSQMLKKNKKWWKIQIFSL
jgi:hypothetical protein